MEQKYTYRLIEVNNNIYKFVRTFPYETNVQELALIIRSRGTNYPFDTIAVVYPAAGRGRHGSVDLGGNVDKERSAYGPTINANLRNEVKRLVDIYGAWHYTLDHGQVGSAIAECLIEHSGVEIRERVYPYEFYKKRGE